MSGGMRVVFNGVRGSTPCAGPRVRAFRWPVVVRRARDRRRAARSCSTSVPACAPYSRSLRGRVPRHGAAVAPALGSRAGPSVLHAAAPRGRGARRVRTAPGRTAPLGEVFAQMMRPPFFPITPNQLGGDVRFHGTGEDDFPVGSAKVRSRWVRHVGPTLGLPRRPERRVGRVRARPRPGLSLPSTPTTTSRTRCSSCATASTC